LFFRVYGEEIFHDRDLTRQSRNQSSKPYFTAEIQSSQRSEYFLINNSLLCALGASVVRQVHYVLSLSKDAVRSPEICASHANFSA
jgi:hypothetical protein